jgi:hypothetical protein
MTAYALLPKEFTKGMIDHTANNKKKKKKKVVADTSKEEPSIEGSPNNTQRDSEDKEVGEPRFVDQCLSPIAELAVTKSIEISRTQSRLKMNISDFNNDQLAQSP